MAAGIHKAILAAVVLSATFARADIALKTGVTFRDAGDGRVEFSGSFLNEGSQTAENAAVTIEPPLPCPGTAPETICLGHIDPRAERTWDAAYTHPDAARTGLFAAVVRVAYEDSNGFPLGTTTVFPYPLGDTSATSPAAVLSLAAPMRDIEGTALDGVPALREIAPLDGSATFTLTVTPAPDAAGRPASLRIVTPPALGVIPPEPTLATIPDDTVEISFTVTNLASLGGSRLPVGVILDAADADGTCRTATTQLVVPIGATPPELVGRVRTHRTYEPEVRAAVLALLAFFLIAEFLTRRRLHDVHGPLVAGDCPGSPISAPLLEGGCPGSPISAPLLDGGCPGSPISAPLLEGGCPGGAGGCFSRGVLAADWLAVLAVWALLAWQVRLPLVFSDTLCLGGDLPAHHYLFSHLRESLAHGRLVSWAPGWWCGFPMYQYYFPLPYLAMCALDLVLPANIAFKLALVLGLFLTPLCTLAAARLMRLPRPAPAMLVLATAPLLCDSTHTMWGVNIASTLSGMISNSWSFAFFPLAIASAVADMRDNRPRARTAFLFLAVLLSHFFTSIVLALLLGIVFVGVAACNARRPAETRTLHPLALIPTGLCAALLMAWWVLPLVATRPWSVDYGDPWDIHLFRNLPIAVKGLAIPAAVAVALAAWRLHGKSHTDSTDSTDTLQTAPTRLQRGESHTEALGATASVSSVPSVSDSRAKALGAAASVGYPCYPCHPCETIAPEALGAAASVSSVPSVSDSRAKALGAALLATLQAAVAFGLFEWGYSISKVFVNCRLWPFLVHALLVLGALGAASLLRRAPHPRIGLATAALVIFAFAWDVPNLNRGYAQWDFQGIEALSDAPVFFDVAERMRGTPGRFAYDMHPGNERLGSSRAFEALPAVCGKPLIEGGILNSALGALVAYSVQGEMSDSPAGWPLRVIPKKLDVETGTRHLELLGVRHFLARSGFVQDAIEKTGRWTLLNDYGKWRLYENPAVDGSLVHAYPDGLPELATDDPQGAIVDWAQDPALADTPVILRPSAAAPSAASSSAAPHLRRSPFTGLRDQGQRVSCPCEPSFNRIQFTTEHVGAPHLVAVSYFPNWRVEKGADRIDLATPGLMVVTPTEREVVLRFAPMGADWIGRIFLVPGALLLLVLLMMARQGGAGTRGVRDVRR